MFRGTAGLIRLMKDLMTIPADQVLLRAERPFKERPVYVDDLIIKPNNHDVIINTVNYRFQFVPLGYEPSFLELDHFPKQPDCMIGHEPYVQRASF